jgi:hypothetical protein
MAATWSGKNSSVNGRVLSQPRTDAWGAWPTRASSSTFGRQQDSSATLAPGYLTSFQNGNQQGPETGALAHQLGQRLSDLHGGPPVSAPVS